MSVDFYARRIGRTGRAGAVGVAYSYFTPADGRLAKQILSILKEASQHVPPELEEFAAAAAGGIGAATGGVGKSL